MTRREDRQSLAAEITVACAAGARLAPACRLAGIDLRTFQRWRAGEDGQVRADRRPEAVRPAPQHALSEAERARIVALASCCRDRRIGWCGVGWNEGEPSFEGARHAVQSQR